jgi:hypothetical protein
MDLRGKLESALYGSFCILGNTQDVEASALLANSILTGRVIRPGGEIFLILCSILAAMIACLLVKSLNPVSTIGVGAIFTAINLLGFSIIFIFSGYWLDPLAPTAASAMGVMFSFIWVMAARRRYNRQFSLAYGPFVSRSCLKSVIRAGNPLPSQIITTRAAVIAVKNSAAYAGPQESFARTVLSFQEKASELFKKAGGTVTDTENDMVTACFGSPLERVFAAGRRMSAQYEGNIDANSLPARRAIEVISEIEQLSECKAWQFGLDMGNCIFAWTPLSGYFAIGTPVQKARILSRLAGRYHTRLAISSTVNEALPDLPVKKLDTLKGNDGGEAFYRLTGRN